MAKLDVLSDHSVPFEVAAFCRGRPYLPLSVSLRNALRAKNEAQARMDQAEKDRDAAEARVADAAQRVQDFMTASGER